MPETWRGREAAAFRGVRRPEPALAGFGLAPGNPSRSRRSHTSEHGVAITIRDATPEDAPAIAHARGASWRAAYEHVFGPERLATISEDDDARRWQGWLSDPLPRWRCHVVVSGSDVVGFSSYGQCREDAALGELFTIYVLPEEWGRGAGQALMRETLEGLRALGFGAAVLWVLEDNPRTRRFYELAGWQPDGEVTEQEWLGLVVREVRYRIDLR